MIIANALGNSIIDTANNPTIYDSKKKAVVIILSTGLFVIKNVVRGEKLYVSEDEDFIISFEPFPQVLLEQKPAVIPNNIITNQFRG